MFGAEHDGLFPPSYSVIVCPTMENSSIIKECIRSIQLYTTPLSLSHGRRPNQYHTRRTSIYKGKATMSTPLKKLSLEVMRELPPR
jgi:hypothetical protein